MYRPSSTARVRISSGSSATSNRRRPGLAEESLNTSDGRIALSGEESCSRSGCRHSKLAELHTVGFCRNMQLASNLSCVGNGLMAISDLDNSERLLCITVAVFRCVAALPLSVTPGSEVRLHGVTSFRPSLVTLSWRPAAGRCSGASGRRPGAACVVVTSAARRRAGRG